MTVRKFRQSEIKAFKGCRRNWDWSYRRGYGDSQEDPSKADIGTIVHAALEEYGMTGEDPTAVVRTLRNADERIAVLGPSAVKWEGAYLLAEIMVEGYVDWLAETGKDADYRVLTVERQMEVLIGNILGDDVYVTGKLDVVVEHEPTGLVYLRDYKTVDSLSQAGRQLQVDDQLLTYALLLRLSDGVRIAGAEHELLRRVKRTATANPPFYDRVQVHFNDTHMRNHYRHLYGVLAEMVRVAQAIDADPDAHHDVAPPSPSRDCTWKCHAPGLDLCIMLDDGSNAAGYIEEYLTIRKAT